MRYVGKMKYTFVLVILLSGIIFSGDCAEFDPLIVSLIDCKFHVVQPAHEVDDGYVFNYYLPSSDSHLFYGCPSERDILKLTEIDQGIVKSGLYKCTSKVKSTSELFFMDNNSRMARHRIGFKVSGEFEGIIPDECQQLQKRQKINSQKKSSKSVKIPEESQESEFLGLILVTFDTDTASTLYVHYPYLFTEGIRRPQGTIMKNFLFDPDETVFFDERSIILDVLYSKSKENADSKLYLVKCQLAPADDFLLDTWKETTYHDLNTAPMYNIFVDRWQSIEDEIRQRLYFLENAHVGVGTALFPETTEPNYMDGKLVRIPDLFYKVVANVNAEEVEGIIIIMHNNPYLDREPVCEDTCAANNWTGISNENFNAGRTYCCDLNKENLQKLRIPLTGDFAKNKELNPLNMGKVTVVGKYLQFPIKVKMDFRHWLEVMNEQYEVSS